MPLAMITSKGIRKVCNVQLDTQNVDSKYAEKYL